MKTIRFINGGGFGEVHEVEINGISYAQKTFKPPATVVDPQAIEKLKKRFIREVQIQSHVKHPNVMPIVAYDLKADPPWFTMPLATQSLEQSIIDSRSTGTWTGHLQPGLWQDILAGVEELHRLGYVHRDLKPANVLLVDGAWVIADLGLVLPTARETTVLTSSHSAYGSHFYAAPEQASDFRNVPEQTDVFALGCILHDATDSVATRVPYAKISSSGSYNVVIARSTEPNPKDRYPNIAAFRAALFEVAQTGTGTSESTEFADLLAAATSDTATPEAWKTLIVHVEAREKFSRHMMLQSITAEMLIGLRTLDDVLFGRMMTLICDWARSTGFDWNYCDVVGDRLFAVYQVSPVRIRCEVVLAALELAVSHNRWHVMHLVGSMLGQTSDSGLADRLVIEAELKPEVAERLLSVEGVVSWSREKWHSKIGCYLDEYEKS